jgi:ABC-type multidrug transport system permease subunit
MPRKKKVPEARKFAEREKAVSPKLSDCMLYSLLIALVAVFISGAYYRSIECAGSCIGENIANGYPYPWFSYSTYGGWQTGSINWLGGILDIFFWMFIAFVVMLVLNAAIKEV